jgi:hypothetical protein
MNVVPAKININLNLNLNPLFYAPIFTFQINDQKAPEFWQPSDKTQGHFFGLN